MAHFGEVAVADYFERQIARAWRLARDQINGRKSRTAVAAAKGHLAALCQNDPAAADLAADLTERLEGVVRTSSAVECVNSILRAYLWVAAISNAAAPPRTGLTYSSSGTTCGPSNVVNESAPAPSSWLALSSMDPAGATHHGLADCLGLRRSRLVPATFSDLARHLCRTDLLTVN